MVDVHREQKPAIINLGVVLAYHGSIPVGEIHFSQREDIRVLMELLVNNDLIRHRAEGHALLYEPFE